MNTQNRKLTYFLSFFLMTLLVLGKESQFLDVKSSSRVLQTYTNAQLQQSPYADSTWASNIINYQSNWPLQLAPAPFDGQDCFNVQNAWSFVETFYVNDGFIYSTVAQGYLALRLIGQSYQLVVESTLDQTAQQWTIPYPNPISGVPLPLGWVPIYQQRNGVYYGITQTAYPPDNGVLLTPSSTLSVSVTVVDPSNPGLNQRWNFHAAGTSAPANYPVCFVVVHGSLADSTTNNPISATVLTGATPIVSFTPSSGQTTYYATVDPSTGSFSVNLPPGTYSMISSISQYQPQSRSVSVSGSSASLTLNPFFMTPINTNVVISGYLSDPASNQVLDPSKISSRNPSVTFYTLPSGQSYQATFDLTTGIYTATLPPGTYNRVVTMKGYLPSSTTVVIGGSSDQTNSFNTVNLEVASWRFDLTGTSSTTPIWVGCRMPDLTWIANWLPVRSSQQISIGPLNGFFDYEVTLKDLYLFPGTWLCRATTLGRQLYGNRFQVKIYRGSTWVQTFDLSLFVTDPAQANDDIWNLFNLIVSETDDETLQIINDF